MFRKLFLFIISLAVFASVLPAQTPAYTVHLLGPLPIYRGTGTNLKIPFLQILSADADSTRAGTARIGKKYPLIIGFHGIGEKTTSYGSASTVGTADILSLFNTSLPSLLRYTTSTLYNKRYAAQGRTDSTSFCYLFPQVYGGYSVGYQTYAYNMIKYAKDSLSDIIDTNRIYLAGLSFGGGQVIAALQDTNILRQVAAGIANCAGYINTNASLTPYNFKAMSGWGGLLILSHSTNDSTTDKNPITKEGSYYSDRARDSLYKYPNSITHLIYKRWTTGGHSIWDRAYNPANSVNSYPQSNQQNSAFAVNFHVYFLSYSRSGDGKIIFQSLYLLAFIPFKRRKSNIDEEEDSFNRAA